MKICINAGHCIGLDSGAVGSFLSLTMYIFLNICKQFKET